jgi:hypothetical protein
VRQQGATRSVGIQVEAPWHPHPHEIARACRCAGSDRHLDAVAQHDGIDACPGKRHVPDVDGIGRRDVPRDISCGPAVVTRNVSCPPLKPIGTLPGAPPAMT